MTIRTLPTRTRRLIAVCAKCGTKAGGGFGEGGKRSLAKALRRCDAVGKGKRAAIKVVETRCLGICPKRAVVMVDGTRPGEAVLVPVGTPVEAVLDLLDIEIAG